ncbi:MAG: hypothetical protein EA363_01835 [Balneolaceae bacterium]|nr:MAG: hypothetical protein EA363_01835 [Balneolaceae bacterium]
MNTIGFRAECFFFILDNPENHCIRKILSETGLQVGPVAESAGRPPFAGYSISLRGQSFFGMLSAGFSPGVQFIRIPTSARLLKQCRTRSVTGAGDIEMIPPEKLRA